MANLVYNNYKSLALKGSVAVLTDTIKVALFKSTYTPNIDTDIYFSDISANEASGTGYTSGGVTLTSPVVTTDTTNDRGVFSGANTTFSSVTLADFRYVVAYKSTGVAGTSPLMSVYDLGSTQSSSGGSVTIQWGAAGIMYIG
jgi:hypothetical protein